MNPLRYFAEPIITAAVKDLKITVRYRTWFVATVFWPILFPFSFIFFGKGLAGTEGQGLATFASLARTGDFASFLVIGNLVWMFVNVNLWTGGLALRNDKVRGIFETQMTLPVSKIALVLGAVLASLILNFVPMLVSFAFYGLIGVLPIRGNILAILAMVLCISPFLLGFLLAFSALTMRVRDSGIIVQVTRAILSILCGMQFPLAVLPGFAGAIGRWIPLTHFVDALRNIIIEDAPLGAMTGGIRFMLVSGLLTLAAGVGLFEMVRTNVRRAGMDGGY